jgi:hypothetical protein
MTMAKEISRTFDTGRGAVVVHIEDQHGNVSMHTMYLAQVADVGAAVARTLTDTDTHAAVIHERLLAAGWKPTP